MQPTWENEKYGIRLYRGDCRDIVPQLPAGSIDAVITDPPYGTTACSWDTCIPFDVMWDFIRHVRKPNAAVVLTGSEPFSSFLRVSNIKEFKYDCVWDKVTASHFWWAQKRPLIKTEYISVFYSAQPVYNPQMILGKKPYKGSAVFGSCSESHGSLTKGTIKYADKNRLGRIVVTSNGERYPLNILTFKRDIDKYHPTQKPVALMEYLIRTYTNPGDVVLDFTMGSGTTMVACVNTGRRGIGIEMDTETHGDKYLRIAIKRIKGAIQEAESDMFRS